MSIESGSERVLVWDEPISNAPTLIGPAVFRFIFWLTNSGPGIARNKVWWTIFGKDKAACARALVAELDRKPTIAIPIHGAAIEGVGFEKVRSLLAPLLS